MNSCCMTPATALRRDYDHNTRRPVGANPPAGAVIDYVLPADASSELTLDIVNGKGEQIPHLSQHENQQKKCSRPSGRTKSYPAI